MVALLSIVGALLILLMDHILDHFPWHSNRAPSSLIPQDPSFAEGKLPPY